MFAVANLTAAIVDAMGESEVPPFIIHRFLDRLNLLHEIQLEGEAGEFLVGIIEVVRRTVPCND